MAQPRKKPRKPKKICTWIRERISPYCFGVKVKAGNPAHCNKNDDILYQFQSLKMGWFGRRLSRLKNKDMSGHFAGTKTFYFTADGRSSVPEVLVNIDIDCHNSGTFEGAVAFGEHLRSTRFPNLYFEASTNGKGVHGYIVVVKGDLGDEGLNGALTVLDRWLKAEQSKGNWDVENVEIKGHAPEFTWGQEKYELRAYKSGQLAKLPREALTRADELRGTTRVAVDDLRRLYIPVAKVESTDSVVSEGRKSAKKPSVVSSRQSENRDEEPLIVSHLVKKKTSGSIVGRHFDEEELGKLKGSYSSLSENLLGGEVLVANSRKVVTEQDMAVFLMLLKFFTANMNANGSLPTARWREMWKALFEAGDIERAWCHHRFARMRNFLSDKDLLSWDDEEFVVGILDDDGRFQPGKAAKWRASEELISMMKNFEERFDVGVVDGRDSEAKVAGNSMFSAVSILDRVRDEGNEKGESTLYGYINCNQVQQEESRTTTDKQLDRSPYAIPILTLKSRQTASFLEDLATLGLEIPLQKPRFSGYSTGHYRMAA